MAEHAMKLENMTLAAGRLQILLDLSLYNVEECFSMFVDDRQAHISGRGPNTDAEGIVWTQYSRTASKGNLIEREAHLEEVVAIVVIKMEERTEARTRKSIRSKRR